MSQELQLSGLTPPKPAERQQIQIQEIYMQDHSGLHFLFDNFSYETALTMLTSPRLPQ